MAVYELEVKTGDMASAGTWDHISVTLIGTEGQSQKTELDGWGRDFRAGSSRKYCVKVPSSLGSLLLLRLDKDPALLISEDMWYCCNVKVCTPEGAVLLFPCYRWISRGEEVELRAAKPIKVFEEEHPVLKKHREKELKEKKDLYQWKVLEEGLPHKIHFDNEEELPLELQRSEVMKSEVSKTRTVTGLELKLKGFVGSQERWEKLDDMKKIFCFKESPLSEYTAEHWRDDDFFGSQFLNGVNPMIIKQCQKLPSNFPVTNEMVQPFLDQGESLKTALKKGKVFLYDAKKLEGIPPRTYNGTALHVTPGLCLFYMNSEQKLKPIAIQLYQQPAEDNPIFLPSDSETDWLLAKMFIKNTDQLEHESVHHLMNTHLLMEVFIISTLHNLPTVHPIYKLLFPHFRNLLPVNINGRKVLFGPQAVFDTSSLANEGVVELMRRCLSELTYSDLCLPENITSRGLDSVPNFYYRDDGLKLWTIISSFVQAVVEHYYPSNTDVKRDSELQDWIREIFIHGFLENKASGFPQSFSSVQELVKFLTMVIFTASAQHAAVNSGQYDYLSWMPNASLLLVTAPPSTKGQSNMQSVLDALPNIGDTAKFVSVAWILTDEFTDVVFLGSYPEERFDEPAVKQMIKEFQAELSYLNDVITERNKGLQVPYTYLLPLQIDSSILR